MSEVDLGVNAFWWLTAMGVVSGVGSLVAFRRWSDAEKIRSAMNAMVAHLMEFRLFADEPMVILRAQRDILTANARLLRLLVVPLILLTVPYAVILAMADAFFGRAPLRLGEAAVVTVQCSAGLPDVQLITPPGIDLETPAVRVRSQNQMSWRIRPTRASTGKLRLRWNSRVLEKTISAEPGLHWISEQRSSSLLNYLAHPREFPFRDRTIQWVRIQYANATVLGLQWWAWFSVAAAGGALLSTLG